MNRIRTLGFTVAGIAAVAGSLAFAQPTKDTKTVLKAPAGQPPKDLQLPPGMTAEDAAACAAAATPGAQQQALLKGAGVWTGKQTMWMAPGADPVKSDMTSTVTPIMDGRFTRCEIIGDMMGMPFTGFGIYGFDNVGQKYQCTWIDNMTTQILTGTGEASSDGKTMTWTYTMNCPITKKPTTIREVDRETGKDSKVMEMYTIDPKSGKEYKMMEVNFTRTGPAPVSAR